MKYRANGSGPFDTRNEAIGYLTVGIKEYVLEVTELTPEARVVAKITVTPVIKVDVEKCYGGTIE